MFPQADRSTQGFSCFGLLSTVGRPGENTRPIVAGSQISRGHNISFFLQNRNLICGALGYTIPGIFMTIEISLWCNFYFELAPKQSIKIMKPDQGFVPKCNPRSARWDMVPSHFLTPCLYCSSLRCSFSSESVSHQVKQMVDAKALYSSCS